MSSNTVYWNNYLFQILLNSEMAFWYFWGQSDTLRKMKWSTWYMFLVIKVNGPCINILNFSSNFMVSIPIFRLKIYKTSLFLCLKIKTVVDHLKPSQLKPPDHLKPPYLGISDFPAEMWPLKTPPKFSLIWLKLSGNRFGISPNVTWEMR